MSKGMTFLESPYGFEVFLNPGEVVNLAGVWLSMISIIFECSRGEGRRGHQSNEKGDMSK